MRLCVCVCGGGGVRTCVCPDSIMLFLSFYLQWISRSQLPRRDQKHCTVGIVLLGLYCWDCTVGIILLGSIGSQQYIVHRTVGIFEVLFLFTVIAVLLVNYVVALLLLFF